MTKAKAKPKAAAAAAETSSPKSVAPASEQDAQPDAQATPTPATPKTKQAASSASNGKSGFPSLDYPVIGYTNQAGQPRVLIVSHVHEPGERTEAGKGQLVDGYICTQPGDPEGFSGAPVYHEKIGGGTRGEEGTWHYLDPQVKV